MSDDAPNLWGTDPTASIEAYLGGVVQGEQLAKDFGAWCEAFVKQRVQPLIEMLNSNGQPPDELFRGLASLFRNVADAFERAIDLQPPP